MIESRWLLDLPERREVETLVENVIGFSKKMGCFSNCGLYAVGSSLRKKNYSDIDICLVGLDFRMVFEYSRAHLFDHEYLVDGDMFIKGHIETANPDNKINFGGEDYYFRGLIDRDMYDSFSVFDYIHASGFVQGFLRTIRKDIPDVNEDYFDDHFDPFLNARISPFLRYETAHGDFLGTRDRIKNIDFIVHGENLLVPFWKDHQDNKKLPYVALHEWPDASKKDLSARRLPYPSIDLPSYIDPFGKERSTVVCNDLVGY